MNLNNAGCLAIAAALCAMNSLASAQTLNPLQSMLRSMNPQVAAQQDFERAVKDYRQCIAAHPNDIRPCEGQRAIMDATSRAYAATVQSNTSVYVTHGPR